MSSMNGIEKMPWWYPPKDCFWFDFTNSITINNNELIIIDQTLPNSSIGTIRWFGQNISSSAAWNFITWTIKIKGGTDSIYGQLIGQVSNFNDPTDIYIPLSRGSRIQLTAKSSIPIDITVSGRLKGWYYIEELCL